MSANTSFILDKLPSNSSSNKSKPSKNKTSIKKKPSPTKTKTLKKQLDNLNLDDVNNSFTLTYTAPKRKRNKVKINYFIEDGNTIIKINKPNEIMDCVAMSYNPDTRTIKLIGLLLVGDSSSCRKLSTIQYLDLIFNIIKVLPDYPQLNFNPCNVNVYDEARKPIFNFMGDVELSPYKLLTDGRTFYEGYGFLPYNIDDCHTPFNYGIFETLIGTRFKILNTPISKLADYIGSILENKIIVKETIQNFKKNILDFIALTTDDKINTNLTMTELFKYLLSIIDDDIMDNEELQSLFEHILDFADEPLHNILTSLNLNYSSHNLNYFITTDTTHYEKIEAIYSIYNIKRHIHYTIFLKK